MFIVPPFIRNALLAVGLACAAALAGIWFGWQAREDREAKHAAEQLAHTIQTERELHEDLAKADASAQAANKQAALADARYAAALRRGAIRLSIPIVRVLPPAPGASGVATETRAELAGATAARIDSVGVDGDAAIRDLNECIDLYRAAQRKINER